ncbi:MAG: MBL fold metallo-hydrolase [bacterium]|nr:MBL fold metallo-hydrolase [bacterium]
MIKELIYTYSLRKEEVYEDYIHGFPFFKPAYDKKRNFTIAICGYGRNERDLQEVFDTQMRRDFFPVPLDQMGGNFRFWEPQIDLYIAESGNEISASKLNHPGDSYGYRVQDGNSVLVYCTDVEHADGIDPHVVELARDADLLIHDAQYTPEELKLKKGWGHSSWKQAAEVARLAGAKKLALFHDGKEIPVLFCRNDDLSIKDFNDAIIEHGKRPKLISNSSWNWQQPKTGRNSWKEPTQTW